MNGIKLTGMLSEKKQQGIKNLNESDYLQASDVRNLSDINGWAVDYSTRMGTIAWYHKPTDTLFYATPSWDGVHGLVPFEGESARNLGTLDFSMNSKKYEGNISLQKKEYISAVKLIIKKLGKRK